jgi:anti-sigma factor RsiW
MHEPVIQRLEEYLDGDGPFPEVEEHLRKCEDCKNELDAMRQQSALFRQAFKAEVEPNPAFYARVMGRIETQARPSVWSLFGESMFAKRLSYASATFLVLVGVVFMSATNPDQGVAFGDPEMILAGEERYTPVSMDTDTERDRQVVLVNLTTYQHPQSQDFH